MPEKTGTVVFHHQFPENAWLGGTHYFRNLHSVTSKYSPSVELKGVNLNSIPTQYHGLADWLCLSWYNRIVKKVPQRIIAQGRINYLTEAAGGNRFCVYSTDYTQIAQLSGVNAIFWIPDFQMFHLPDFFTEEDIQYRKKNYAAGCELASLVVVSSENAKKDIEKFFPQHVAKARVLRFVTEIDPLMKKDNPAYVCEKYSLPKKFFYVPNQYWKHKNHMMVIEALAGVVKLKPDVHVVFSGSQSDSRNPEWTGILLQKIESLGVRYHITETGVIPKEDVYALMRQCCCMINMSRFEGWSTTVEESKAIGKQIILSSIDVHREQAPPDGIYVDADDAEGLSRSMLQIWEATHSGPDSAREAEAEKLLAVRLKEFAATFQKIIDESFTVMHK